MEAVLEIAGVWAEAFVRWLHVLAGIAWIGSSFYFVALDQSLKPRAALPAGAHGEAWQVHGGGFYHMVKYLVAPAKMPDELKWFKWEAYTTWLSGFGLMILVYYFQAELYLIDPAVLDVSPAAAALISVAVLAFGWLGYDALCRAAEGRDTLLLVVGFLALTALAALFQHALFSGRGAFMQFGALIGTIMVANVAMVIIPGQRKVVAALIAGDAPDPALGRRAKQRSLHNNYLTLPTVFVMIAGHYPLAFASAHAWAILALLLAMGALIRHFFNTRHSGAASPWWVWGAVAGGALAIVALSAAERLGAESAAARAQPAPAATLAAAHEVIETRCTVCHAAEPVWEGVAHPPKGLVLEAPGQTAAHAQAILLQSGWTRAMPPGNVTDMTEDERAILVAWYAAR